MCATEKLNKGKECMYTIGMRDVHEYDNGSWKSS